MVHAVEMKLAHAKLRRESSQFAREGGLLISDAPDPRRYCNLSQEVEPACDPGRKSCALRLGNHGSPEIGPAARRMCAANL